MTFKLKDCVVDEIEKIADRYTKSYYESLWISHPVPDGDDFKVEIKILYGRLVSPDTLWIIVKKHDLMEME